MSHDERRLWQAGGVECVMISCCSGAELQIRKVARQAVDTSAGDVVLRELYPTKSDLYERAHVLEREYANR